MPIPTHELIKLEWFDSWIVGFTVAEGSFSFKNKGSAFYTIRQAGLENYEIIKAICLRIAHREARPIKPDTGNSYKLALTSKADINKVIYFLTSANHHYLVGFKLIQFNIWLII